METLLDSHYHFDFIENSMMRQSFLQYLDRANIYIVAQTLRPSQCELLHTWLLKQKKALQSRVLLSLGFHPWYIGSKEESNREWLKFKQLLPSYSYIGEIGLDFSKSRLQMVSKEKQIDIFHKILREIVNCSRQNDEKSFVLSIHTVHSAETVVDMMVERGVYKENIIPILHRYNDNNIQLTRHLRLGGYISVHPKMLQTKKGRAYIRQIADDRLLLETDLPGDDFVKKSDSDILAKKLTDDLNFLIEGMSEIKKCNIMKAIQHSQSEIYNIK